MRPSWADESRRCLVDETVEFLLGCFLNALGDFKIGVEELVSLVGEAASVGAVAIEQLDFQGCFGFFDDAPGLAVRHADALRGGVQRALLANAEAQIGDAAAEHRSAFGVRVLDRKPDGRSEVGELAHGFPFFDGFCLPVVF